MDAFFAYQWGQRSKEVFAKTSQAKIEAKVNLVLVPVVVRDAAWRGPGWVSSHVADEQSRQPEKVERGSRFLVPFGNGLKTPGIIFDLDGTLVDCGYQHVAHPKTLAG